MQKALLVTGLVASTMLIGVPAKSAPVTFTDGTFNLANYAQSPQFITGAGATLTVVTCVNCGNPFGAGLQITGTFPNTPPAGNLFTAAEVLVNTTFAYNPLTQGPIDVGVGIGPHRRLFLAQRACFAV